MKPTLYLAGLGLMAMTLSGCMSGNPDISASGTPATGAYTMRVDVEDFDLVDFAGKTSNEEGQGHIHFLVNGKDACSAGKATCAAPTDYATTKTSFAFKGLVKGDKITAELVNNDHSSLDPKVSVTQTV